MTDKKIRRIETIEEAQAFMSFLAAERNRHVDDVRQAERDLLMLAEQWGLEIPWDNTYFVVVEKEHV